MLRTTTVVCVLLPYFIPMFLLAGRSRYKMRDFQANVRSDLSILGKSDTYFGWSFNEFHASRTHLCIDSPYRPHSPKWLLNTIRSSTLDTAVSVAPHAPCGVVMRSIFRYQPLLMVRVTLG